MNWESALDLLAVMLPLVLVMHEYFFTKNIQKAIFWAVILMGNKILIVLHILINAVKA